MLTALSVLCLASSADARVVVDRLTGQKFGIVLPLA